ncbi:hypothetical protein R1flu_020855 [Riccia fluitans]|uniref:Uncharacterized protein n=1 Tax=Riccia fluitans TaxID=41844 RepID=A0ABD1ZMP7_9MARC
MASVESMSQLERMGSELRCAICLSLFKVAATISCNHTFCRSCILESLRTNSCCPVCKTHSSRREARPAPQMDSLVEIFRGMETSAGVNLFTTQPSTQAAFPENVPGLDKGKGGKGKSRGDNPPSKKKKAPNQSLDPRKRRRKTKGHDSDSDDGLDVDEGVARGSSQGVVLAKKRVQVPQDSRIFLDLNLQSGVEPERVSDEQPEEEPQEVYRPSSLPDHSSKVTTEVNSGPGFPLDFRKPQSEVLSPPPPPPPYQKEEISKRPVDLLHSDDNVQQDKAIDLNLDLELQGFPSLRQAFNELPQLTPFFWLPTDPVPSQDEALPTQTQFSAQPLRPSFSDLKDSDDEGSLDDVQQPGKALERAHGEAEGYDSETFEWTQRPSSPELSCSPSKYRMQPCSKRTFTASQPKHEAQEMRQISPSGVESSLTGANLVSQAHPETLRNRVLGAPSTQSNPSSGHCEESQPPSFQRSLRSRDNSDVIRHSAPSPREATDSLNDSEAAIPANQTNVAKSQAATSEDKICEAAANRFLSLLRDDPPKVAPQPLPANTGVQAPTVQVQNVVEKVVPLEKSKVAKEAASTACRFCGITGNCEQAGEMMRYQMGAVSNKHAHVHKLCAEWAPNVYFEEEDACPKNLASEISRGSRIKCIICGKKGAALGCCNNKCKNSYHYPCARRLEGCQWNEDDYVMFCPQHARKRCSVPRRQSRDSSNSTLENEPAEVPSVPAVRPYSSRANRVTFVASEGNKSSKWASGLAQKWVLCGSGLDSGQKAQVASFASLVGATLVKDWSSAVTHVITGTDEQGAAKRTLKYLLAMLEGKWIVKIDWMNECILNKRPVAEDLHLVTCDVNGFFGGPCLSRHLAVSKGSKLFQGLSFYLSGDFSSALKADLHSLVTAGGGIVLHRKPLPLPVSSYTELPPPPEETPRAGQNIVLYNGEADSGKGRNLAQRIQEAMSVSIPAGAHALPCSWLLDSIAHCRLLPPN